MPATKTALTAAGVLVCAAATVAPTARADGAHNFATPWGTRCQVTAATASCDTCEPGLVLSTPAAAQLCGTGPQSDQLVTNAAGVQQNSAPGVLPPSAEIRQIRAGQTYHANGWTITTPISADGVHFTNDATGHGMAVAPQNYYFY